MNSYITIGSLTERAVEHLVRYCLVLEHLSLTLFSLTSTLDPLLDLFNSPKRALKLRTISLSSAGKVPTNEHVVRSLADNCLNLKRLDLSGVPCVDDALVSSLKHCKKLSHLNIKGCKQVSNEAPHCFSYSPSYAGDRLVCV